MPDFIIMILLLLSGVVAFFSFIVAIHEGEPAILLITGLCVIVFISLVIWCRCSAACDWEVVGTYTTTITEVDNQQIITFPKTKGSSDFQTVNLNKKFGRNYAVGTKVTIEYQSHGPYAGIVLL